MNRPTDELLMTALRRGELPPLATLFERHAGRLFGFLLGLVGSPSAAEDLVQETFLRILRHRRSYRAGRAFLPWFLGIARNAAWRHLKNRARESSVEPHPTDTGSPEHRYIERQRSRLLVRELLELPAKEREILLLSYFEGLRHRQIARLVGSTPGAVKVRAHRARQLLRARMEAAEKRP